MISCTITISGTVQGVGFRPFVYRLAHAHGIAGTVRNSPSGVVITARGDRHTIDAFIRAIQSGSPPLAHITGLVTEETADTKDYSGFSIAPSRKGDSPDVDVTRDTAPCEACLREMSDPANRRHNHPFVNCTDCGPRYTIIKKLPYDRPDTTMAEFCMCDECRKEYDNPADRRFHAQPVCCPNCGPSLTLLDKTGNSMECDTPLAHAIGLIAEGAILAVKGLGGFHLACRADSPAAVTALRQRKHREQKPLAVMVENAHIARKYCILSDIELALLTGIERPICICRTQDNCSGIAADVAPRLSTLGIMLPSTPLHYLLFATDRYDALVMTSGNLSAEPICASTGEAVDKLEGIADFFLVHDRGIHVRVDDSIVRILDKNPVLLRRARGFVPAPLTVDLPVDGIIALGGIMKSTICVGRNSTCYVSHYLGKADCIETLDNASAVLDHYRTILGVEPQQYVTDNHPGGFASSIIADSTVSVLKVQHHHAHAAACLAENRIRGKALCLVYDGLGLGEDDTIWGGELLVADCTEYSRTGHLLPMLMPGGDAATLNPARMALGALWETFPETAEKICPWIPRKERCAIYAILESGIQRPVTTSMGRLFDSLAAILDICRKQTYEGQPAIELEECADRNETGAYEWRIDSKSGMLVFDGPLVLKSAFDDFCRGTKPSVVAARFHNSIADMSAHAARRAAETTGLDTICLTGGCFQNKLLSERLVKKLRNSGIKPCFHRILSPGDECISFGQTVVAGAKRSTIDNDDKDKAERNIRNG
ncbi:MAG: carbamoyltransferase HypF [Chitinivibrionales bacterium]|nr:carbamoyltransferase HypF [Chitinivibrionales bacterium]